MADIISIGGGDAETVRAACRAEMDAAGLPIKQASREMGKGVGTATLSRWLAGSYTGDVPAVTARVAAWLQTRREGAAHSLAAAGLDRFAKTAAAADIEDALAYAQATGDIVLIHGPSGRGKTRTAEHYRAAHTGVHYLEATPAMTTMAGLLAAVAEAIGEPGEMRSAREAERLVIRNLRGRGALLVIDEADYLRASLLDELCSIRNKSGCGLALIGYDSVRMTVARCPKVIGRVGMRVDLRVLPAADVAAIAAGPLGRRPGKAEVKALVKAARGKGGLHTLRRVLTEAWKLAQTEGREGIDAESLAVATEGVVDQENHDADDQPARAAEAA